MTPNTDPALINPVASWPIGLFAMVMGLFGLTLSVQAALHVTGNPVALSWPFLALALVGLGVVSIGYGAKLLHHRDKVLADWNDPLRLIFFPAASIALMLAATALLPVLPGLARPVWILGALLQAGLSLAVLSAWTGEREFQLAQISPAWFIPAVGNIVAPIAGARLGYMDVSWIFFASGLVFWVALLPLTILRLVTLGPPPPPLRPTLAVLVAPPSVGALAWMSLTGGADHFAAILTGMGITFALLVAVRLPIYLRLPFGIPLWALTFPWAALSVACLRLGDAGGRFAFVGIGIALTLGLVVLVLWLLLRTIRAGLDGRLFLHPPAAPKPAE